MYLKIKHDKIKFNSLLYAFFIAQAPLCDIVARVVPIPNISIVFMLIITIAFFFNNLKIKRKEFLVVIGIVGGVVALFIISMLLNGTYAFQYLPYFLVFAVPALLINLTAESDVVTIFKFLRAIFFIYLMGYILIYRSYFLGSLNFTSLQMSVAYNLLTILMVESINIMRHKEEKIMSNLISMSNLVLGMYFMINDCQSRGPFVCYAVFIILIWAFKSGNIKRTLLLGTVAIIALLVWNSLSDILMLMQEVLSKFEITIPALSKTIWYMENMGQYDAGRTDMSEYAIECFKMSPVFGIGIGGFEKMYALKNGITGTGVYVHQYLLQILSEFGILGLIGTMVFLVKCISYIFTQKKEIFPKSRLFLLFLMSLSLPRLMMSSTYWMFNAYWLFFALGIMCLKKSKTK